MPAEAWGWPPLGESVGAITGRQAAAGGFPSGSGVGWGGVGPFGVGVSGVGSE